MSMIMLAVPSMGQATDGYARGQIFREVEVHTTVRHSGTQKMGTLTLRMRMSQGVEYYKYPTAEGQVNDADSSIHIGPVTNQIGGSFQQALGAPRFEGCIDLFVKGVVNHRNRCQITGQPQFEADPTFTTVGLSSGFGAVDQFPTEITLDLEGVGDFKDEGQAPVTKTNPAVKGTSASVEFERSVVRNGIVRSGTVFETLLNSFWIIPTPADKVKMRAGVSMEGSHLRGPIMCFVGQPALHIKVGSLVNVDLNRCYPDGAPEVLEDIP